MAHQFANTAIVIITIFIIVTIPLLFAAVQPWIWSFYGLLMMVAFMLHLWTSRNSVIFAEDRLFVSMAAVFMFWTLILCLPMPFSLVSIVSPRRYEIVSTAYRLVDNGLPSWGTVSYLPRAALSWWTFLLGAGLFFIVVRQLCIQRKILKILVYTTVGVALVEAVYGMIQSLVPSMGVLWVDYIPEYMGTARGTFINRNNFAGFLEMIWPLALGITLAQTGRVKSLREALGSDRLNRQALMALGIIVLLLALLLTRSRAGIASGMVGFFVFTFTARAGMRTFARHSRILLGGIVVLVCLYAFSIGVTPILERFLAIRGDASSRMEIWQDSLAMVSDHPFGIGLHNYEHVFPVYNRTADPESMARYAHNDYLQLLIETGWIGFVAAMGGFVIFFSRAPGVSSASISGGIHCDFTWRPAHSAAWSPLPFTVCLILTCRSRPIVSILLLAILMACTMLQCDVRQPDIAETAVDLVEND
jgi:O-antigen ligase